MLIAVLADKAPGGMTRPSFPSAEVSDPPDASIFPVTGFPTGVPMVVMAGVGLSEPEPVEGEEPFLQANAAIRHRDNRNIDLGERPGDIQKVFAQIYYPGGDSAIERK